MGVIPGNERAALAILEPRIRVAEVPGKGRGVLATRTIKKGESIERAPVLVVPKAQGEHVDRTVLEHYVYDWPTGYAIALGNGSIYNHSYAPNASYVKHVDDNVLEYVALTDIEPGEEVVINYNGHPDDKTPLWFTVIER